MLIVARSLSAVMICLLLLAAMPVGAVDLVIYPVNPDHKTDGKVTGALNGQPVTFEYQHTYHPESLGQKEFKANYVRFAADGPVDVNLTVDATITTAHLRTVGKDLPFNRAGSNFTFTLPGPGRYYLQLPNLNTAGRMTYTVFFIFDDLAVYNGYQASFSAARNVNSHGVVSHPTLNQTAAVQAVLNAGGSVYFPTGIYRTGQLSLPSNTTVYLGPGAVLKGIDNYNTNRYLYANGKSNVRIAGLGAIDANGYTAGNIPTKGHGIDIDNASNFQFDDVLLRDSNSWAMHIRRSSWVQVRRPVLFSGKDGIDPDGSLDVLVEGALIQSIDDGFAVKSKDSGRTCERVTMRDSIVFSCASSLKVGTENYEGKVKDIIWDNCDAVDADRGCILYTKENDGVAPISNVTWRNIRVFNRGWTGETGGAPFQVHNLTGASVTNLLFENVVAYPTASSTTYGSFAATFRNVIVNGTSAISGSGVTFEGVIWPGVTSQSRPVVFIEPSPRNQNRYLVGDPVNVSVTHPYSRPTASVELLVDGVSKGIRTSAPWAFPLTGLLDGPHTLQARAVDADGAVNTTAPLRVLVDAGAAPAIVSSSMSSTSLANDDSIIYTVTLTASDPQGADDLRSLRVILDNGGALDSANTRAYLAWGLQDSDILHWDTQWQLFNATGGGRWGFNEEWGSDTYTTPLSASTVSDAFSRTVTWSFRVKPAWSPAVGQQMRIFAHDTQIAHTGWIASDVLYEIVSPAPEVSIAQALKLPPGSRISISGRVASAGTASFDDAFYIQEQDRSSGIRVITGRPVDQGDRVSVRGEVGSTPAGEECVFAEDVALTQSGQPVPDALFFRGRDAGSSPPGVYAAGLQRGEGADGIGLLVKCFGRITARAGSVFYIDDGSGLSDGAGSPGLRVDAAGLPVPPESFAMVTGILTLAQANGTTVRTLRPRGIEDMLGF